MAEVNEPEFDCIDCLIRAGGGRGGDAGVGRGCRLLPRVPGELSRRIQRDMTGWTKPAFENLARGFWATRVANGLTTSEKAEEMVGRQISIIGEWYPR